VPGELTRPLGAVVLMRRPLIYAFGALAVLLAAPNA
jgi:hypothetical protein